MHPLYAEAALEGRSVEDQPVIGLQVARQFVLAGQPAEALQYVPTADKVPPHCFDEYAETMGRAYEALGRTDDLRELRKRHFLHRPDPERLERYLGGLEAKERPTAKNLMRQAVLSGDYDPTRKAVFFAELKEREIAAQIILAEPTAFRGENYPALLPLARSLEQGQPLAASIVYRALLESILDRAQSKTYPHAARYLHRLGKLGKKIRAWSPIAPHESYLQALRARHDRKRRFGPRCRRLTLEQTTDPRLQVQPKFCLRTGARQPSHRFFPVSTVQMNPHTGCPPESEVMVDRAQKVEIRVATAAIGSTRSTHHAGVACSDMVRVMCAPWRIGGEPP